MQAQFDAKAIAHYAHTLKNAQQKREQAKAWSVADRSAEGEAAAQSLVFVVLLLRWARAVAELYKVRDGIVGFCVPQV